MFLWIVSKRLRWKKSIALSVIKQKIYKHKITSIFDKTLVLSIICEKRGNKDEKIFKEEEWIEILKILCLIRDIERYQVNI